MTSSDNEQTRLESWLLDQVTKSEFFHQKLHEYGLLEIAYILESVQGENLDWNLVPFQYDYDACHCEERSDEAIPTCAKQSVSHENVGIASLRSQ